MRREIAGANTTASEMKPPQVPRPQGRIAKPVRRSHPSSGPNGRGFVGFVDSGSPRKHNPWESFAEGFSIEQSVSNFPGDFSRLPAVSFIVPNLADDMHEAASLKQIPGFSRKSGPDPRERHHGRRRM
jgi:hypothetical protein